MGEALERLLTPPRRLARPSTPSGPGVAASRGTTRRRRRRSRRGSAGGQAGDDVDRAGRRWVGRVPHLLEGRETNRRTRGRPPPRWSSARCSPGSPPHSPGRSRGCGTPGWPAPRPWDRRPYRRRRRRSAHRCRSSSVCLDFAHTGGEGRYAVFETFHEPADLSEWLASHRWPRS